MVEDLQEEASSTSSPRLSTAKSRRGSALRWAILGAAISTIGLFLISSQHGEVLHGWVKGVSEGRHTTEMEPLTALEEQESEAPPITSRSASLIASGPEEHGRV